MDQHAAEGGDRHLQQRLAPASGEARLVCRLDGRKAVEEQYVGLDRPLPDQRPQDRQRLFELAVPEQDLRANGRRLGDGGGCGGRCRPGGKQEQKCGHRHGDRAECHGASLDTVPSGPTRDEGFFLTLSSGAAAYRRAPASPPGPSI